MLRIDVRNLEDLERLRDAAQLLKDLDDTPLDQMDDIFYRAGFDSLQLALREVLDVLRRGAREGAPNQKPRH